MIALATAITIFSKAFLESLGSRAGDDAASIPKHAQDLLRICHRRKKGQLEGEIGVQERKAAAKILITADLPDEARLALLDLDVTTDELRGKLLWWDAAVGTWRPSGTTSK
jgi:hypothetical protein